MEGATISVTVASQRRHRPPCHGMSVSLAGRFLSVLEMLRLMMSYLPEPSPHDNPCEPFAVTNPPQGHMRGSQVFAQAYRHAAILIIIHHPSSISIIHHPSSIVIVIVIVVVFVMMMMIMMMMKATAMMTIRWRISIRMRRTKRRRRRYGTCVHSRVSYPTISMESRVIWLRPLHSRSA